MRDIYHNTKVLKSILAIVGNNTTEGTGVAVDKQLYEQALMIFNIGTSLDTLSGSVYITLTLQECATTGGTYTNVAAADMEGTQDVVIDAAAEDDVVVVMGYKGSLGFIRALITFTGTHTNGFPISATAVLGGARHKPSSY